MSQPTPSNHDSEPDVVESAAHHAHIVLPLVGAALIAITVA